MTLKQIKTHNIQSHKDVTIDLPEKGLIRFVGNNSNGKSVITKALEDITSNAITRPAARASLINFDSSYGEITLTRYDDVVLFYHIHIEASQTYAELRIPGKEPIRRYLADKQIPILREKFGLHYDPEAERSINISDPDEALLFFKTPYKSNFSIVTSALRDRKAETAHDEIVRVIKETKTTKSVYEKQLAIAQAALGSLPMHDIAKEEKRRDECLHRIAILEKFKPLGTLPELRKPKLYKPITIPKLVVPELKKSKVVDLRLSIPDLPSSARKLKSIQEGVCPVCHRKFFS